MCMNTGMPPSQRRPAEVLLEGYMLSCIDKLSSDRVDLMRRLALRTLGGHGEWTEQVREEFGLKNSFPDEVRAMWVDAKKQAETKKAELSPEVFVHMVMEENFQDVVEMVSTDLELREQAE